MAGPQNVVTTTLRTGRALIGWMAPNEAVLTMASRQMDVQPNQEQIERAQNARERVSMRTAGIDQQNILAPLPQQVSEYEREFRAHPATQPFFAEGWRIEVADLTRVCSFQPLVS